LTDRLITFINIFIKFSIKSSDIHQNFCSKMLRVARPLFRPFGFTIRHTSVSILGKSHVPSWESLGLMEPAQALDPEVNRKISPMEYIAMVPPIEVDASTAICDGGPGGHPVVYLQLNRINPNEPATCKYCGLRFIKKHAKH
jgi:uncharacterized Zn-finger protein